MHTHRLVAALASAALTVAVPTAAATTAAAAVPAPATSAPSSTSASPHVTTLNRTVTLPFGVAVNRGRVYVADGATSTVSRLRGPGLVPVARGYSGQGADVAGLAFSRDGRRLAFTTSTADHTKTALKVYGPYGSRRTTDLAGYEKAKNPDGKVHYGIDHPSQCQIDELKKLGPDAPPAGYAGQVDSHPYAVAAWGASSWLVADAGGNDLLGVDRHGKVSTVAVLPRQPLRVTSDIAVHLGLRADSCLVGVTYNFESVPTGVAVGRDGWIYVSTLAGGPEDPSLGARSKVYRVNPRTHRSYEVARGLSGATNLAIGPHGRIYVTEFYAGKVSVIRNGRGHTLVQLPWAVSIAGTKNALYVGRTAEFGNNGPVGTGSVVRIS